MVRVKPVRASVRVTRAPGTEAPDGSVTNPVIELVIICAKAQVPAVIKKRSTKLILRIRILLTFGNKRDSILHLLVQGYFP
jgi:hypothetical protein